MSAHSPAPWTRAPASTDAAGSISITIVARDGTPVATAFGKDGDSRLAGVALAEANARLVETAPDLAALVREITLPGGIPPAGFPAFIARCLVALARTDGNVVSTTIPTWEELRDCLQTLVDWAGASGGWDAKVWRDAEAVLERTRVRP